MSIDMSLHTIRFVSCINASGESLPVRDDEDLLTLVVDLALAAGRTVVLEPRLRDDVVRRFPLLEHLPVEITEGDTGWRIGAEGVSQHLIGSQPETWEDGVVQIGEIAGWVSGPPIGLREQSPEIAAVGSPAQMETDADWYYGLQGRFCVACDTLGWPGAPWCPQCHGETAVQEVDPNASFELFTFTRDYLHPTSQAFWPMGVLEGVHGVRLYLPLTDPEPAIGKTYRLGIRILRREAERIVYGWKGIPLVEA